MSTRGHETDIGTFKKKNKVKTKPGALHVKQIKGGISF